MYREIIERYLEDEIDLNDKEAEIIMNLLETSIKEVEDLYSQFNKKYKTKYLLYESNIKDCLE